MIVADRDSKKSAARIRNSKVATQFQQCQSDPLVETETQKAGAAQQQSIPLLEITLVKLPEGRTRGMGRNAVELLPGKATQAAIVVGFDLKSGGSEWKRRKFRYRPRRQERDNYPVASNVQTGEARRSGEKNVRAGGQLRLAQDNFTLGEVGDL